MDTYNKQKSQKSHTDPQQSEQFLLVLLGEMLKEKAHKSLNAPVAVLRFLKMSACFLIKYKDTQIPVMHNGNLNSYRKPVPTTNKTTESCV